jgi:hypothetical protein
MPPPVVEPSPAPTITPTARPVVNWKAGLKAGGQMLAYALIFAGLSYWVHRRLAEELEESIDMARKGKMPSARREKEEDPSKPVYLMIEVRSDEYTRYIPILGFFPESKLFLSRFKLSREHVDPPFVVVEDHSLDFWRPGTTTIVTYTELMIP